MVLILDFEDGHRRMLTLDESGFEESSIAGIEALAHEVHARRPELILVNPRAVNVTTVQLLARLNQPPLAGASYRLDECEGAIKAVS